MAYSNDPYVDEDGEALMDPDAQFEDDDLERNRSPSPIMDDYDEDKVGKPRKRLIKKAGKDATPSPTRSDGDNDLDDFIEDEEEQEDFGKTGKGYGMGKEDYGKSGKSYGMGKEDSGKIGKSYGMGKEGDPSSKGDKKGNVRKRNREEREIKGGKERDRSGDKEEMKELWDTIAGGDSEDDQEGMRTMDDDNFIDDTGVEPSNRYGSDDEGSAGNAPQAEEGEEDDEVNKLFKKGKKKRKKEKTPAELALIVEHFMAELEVIAEEDADLNRQSKPAINKLRKLPMLIEVLSKKHLQQEFLDHGVLTLLKNWLEPLPDGSLPNMNIRSAILNLLTDYPIDLEHPDRREQLKKSGLGKVIMFLSKSDEETTSNRKIAKELVDKWSRPIFNKSTRYEEMRNVDEERVPYRRTPAKKSASGSRGMEARNDDVDEFSKGPKSGLSASRLHASMPEATPLDFVVRPQSKIDPDEIRARAKQQVQDQRRMKMNKRLQQLKAPKKKLLQASKISVEGRGMVKYL